MITILKFDLPCSICKDFKNVSESVTSLICSAIVVSKMGNQKLQTIFNAICPNISTDISKCEHTCC